MKDKSNLTIKILIGVIILLVLVLLYIFAIRPGISKYNVQKQLEGYNVAVIDILSSIQTNGFVEIPISENQSLVLIPYIPQQNQTLTQ